MFLRHSLTALSVFLLATSIDLTAHAKEERSFADKVTIPLDPHSPKVVEAEEIMHRVLDDVPQGKKPLPSQVLIKNGAYVLHGDLFRTGEAYALFESPNGFGLALRTPKGWQLRGLWRVPVTWRTKGWKPSEDDYLPKTPSDKAFELVNLSNRPAPEVVVAGEVDKYFQGNYLFRFSRENRTLHLVNWAMAKPDRCGSYVKLYQDSGRRSIWTEYWYSKWQGDDLVPVASWHDEVPYHENEGGPFIEVEREQPDGRSEKFRITNIENNSDRETSYAITRDNKPYAEITFVWPTLPTYDDDPHEIESAWLFSKLTGLPRDCFPYREATHKHPNFEEIGKVRITGSPEAIGHFSGKTR